MIVNSDSEAEGSLQDTTEPVYRLFNVYISLSSPLRPDASTRLKSMLFYSLFSVSYASAIREHGTRESFLYQHVIIG